jgi:hypothetical protein
VLHGTDGEQNKPYNRRQGPHHQPVRPRVLQAEKVGEAYGCYPPEDQNGPEDSGDALFGCDQTHPPSVGQSLDLVESFRVELFLALRAWLEPLYVLQDVVDDGLPSGSTSGLRHQGCPPLLHQGPLPVDHLFGVGSDELLDVGAPRLWKLVGQPEDVSRCVGLLLDDFSGRPILLPHGDNHELQQNSIDHTQRRVDEAGHVVVLPSRGGGHEALHKLEAREREEADPPTTMTP